MDYGCSCDDVDTDQTMTSAYDITMCSQHVPHHVVPSHITHRKRCVPVIPLAGSVVGDGIVAILSCSLFLHISRHFLAEAKLLELPPQPPYTKSRHLSWSALQNQRRTRASHGPGSLGRMQISGVIGKASRIIMLSCRYF